MDRFRIKDFKRAFSLYSIERLCLECLKPALVKSASKEPKRQNSNSINVKKLTKIVIKEIFVRMKSPLTINLANAGNTID